MTEANENDSIMSRKIDDMCILFHFRLFFGFSIRKTANMLSTIYHLFISFIFLLENLDFYRNKIKGNKNKHMMFQCSRLVPISSHFSGSILDHLY